MQREIIITQDGSPSLFVPALNESYHSRFGALQESRHVFIEAGLQYLPGGFQPIRILEIGFGTGLNAWLSFAQCRQQTKSLYYETIEPYPVNREELFALQQYFHEPGMDIQLFQIIHEANWNEIVLIDEGLQLLKRDMGFEQFNSHQKFHLIYFDAFSPDVQPGLWTRPVFEKLCSLMETNGILTTYCSKGRVRRIMQQAGLKVEKLPGPPGKREIIRATL